MNLTPDTIVCAPGRELAIRDALLPAVAGVVRPENAFVRQIIVSPYMIAGATAGFDYYLLSTSQVVQCILFQNRKSPEFTNLDSPTSEEVWKRRHLLYGVDARYNVGFGDPRYAVQIDSSD
jgi:phage major head subunit gpT-like protein